MNKMSILISKITTTIVLFAFLINFTLADILVNPQKVLAQNKNFDPSYSEQVDNITDMKPDYMSYFDKTMNQEFNYSEIENRLKLTNFDKTKLDDFRKVSEKMQLNPNMTEEQAIKAVGAKSLQPYDIRLIRSLYWIVTPALLGGGNHEWINAKTIEDGYICDQGCKNEKDYTFKPNEDETFSPHYQGKAVKISEIDYMRFTQVTKNEKGDVTDKKKLKMEPIKVEWQEDKPTKPSQASQTLNQGLLSSLNNLFGNSFNNWLSDQTGQDYSQMDSGGRTTPQIIKQIGTFNINDLYSFPQDNDIAFSVNNLSTLGNETGSAILKKSFKDVILKQGFSGGNLLDWETNIGRTTIEDRMALPTGSLKGDSSDNVISNVGERKLEEALKLSEGSISDIKSREDLAEKIGNGYLYKINIDYHNFNGKNYSDTRSKNETEKFDSIFSEPFLIDSILSIDFGTTQSYKNGTIDTVTYKKKIGESIINQKILVYGESDKCEMRNGVKKCVKTNARDEIFGVGVYDPDPFNPNNPKCKIDRFVDGDNSVYKEIGYDALAKSFSKDSGVRESIINWLKNKTADKENKDGYSIDKINLAEIAKSFGLKESDLWAIFIDSIPGEVFQRIGTTTLDAALDMQNETEMAAYLNINQSNDFYNIRLDKIKEEAQKLAKNSKIKSQANEIIKAVDNAKNSENVSNTALNAADLVKIKIENYAYDIEKQVSQISKEKSVNSSDSLKIIRSQNNEIIESRTIKSPENYSEDEIIGFQADNSIGLDIASLVNVLKEKESINDFKLRMGLATWSTYALNSGNDNVLKSALDDIIKNKGNSPSQIITGKVGQENLNSMRDNLNSSFNLGGANEIKSEDLPLFLNGDYKILFKIGNAVFEKASAMRQGALSDIMNNRSTWDSEKGKAGLGELWQAMGLNGAPSVYDGNVFQRMSQNFLEQTLGLLNNTFYGSMNDAIGRNGLENVLSSFGVPIPTNILQLKDTNPAIFDTKLNEFYNQSVINPNSDFWKNFQNTALINQAMQISGLNFGWQTVQNMFSGKNDIGSIVGMAGNVLGNNIINNDAINTVLNANNLVGALKNNDLGSAYGMLQGMFDTNFGSMTGNLPIAQMLSDPKNALKALGNYSLGTLGNNLGIDPNMLFSFFQGGQKDLLGNLANSLGGYLGIPIGDASKMFQGDFGGTMLSMGMSQLQQQLGAGGINLPLGQIMNAFSEITPGSPLSQQAWANAINDAQKIPGWNNVDELGKNILANQFYKDELGKIKQAQTQNLTYGLLDGAFSQLMPGSNFFGMSQALMKGSTDDKIMAAGMFLSGLSGSGQLNNIIADAKAVSDLSKFFKDPKNNAAPMGALSTLGQQFGISSTAMQAIGLALSGNKQQFMQMGESFMTGQIFGILGGAGNGIGSMMYQAFNMSQTFNSLTSAVGNLQNSMFKDPSGTTLTQLVQAQNKLNMFQAGAISSLANMFLGPAISQLDQAIGIPGVGSMLMTAMIYQGTIPGLTGSALLGMMGPQIGLALLGAIAGGILGGQGKGSQEIHITGCGYWPLFEKENKGPDGKCPEELVIKGKMDEKKLKEYYKKVAQYKIRLLLSDLLKMPDKNKIGKLVAMDKIINSIQLFGSAYAQDVTVPSVIQLLDQTNPRRQMLPTQIRTYRCSDILTIANLAKSQYKTYENIVNIWDPQLRQGPGCDNEKKKESYFVSYIDFGF